MRSIKRIIYSTLLVLLAVTGYKVWNIYTKLYSSNIKLTNKESVFVCIPTGSDFEAVKRIFIEKNLLVNSSSFEWAAEKQQYVHNIKPGRYKITNGMNNRHLIALLKSGEQTPVKLKFISVRDIEHFAHAISSQIEVDSVQLVSFLKNNDKLAPFGFTTSTIIGMFVPNTYEMYWNTDIDAFMKRMNKEYTKFWNEKRIEQLKILGLTQSDVITLASIVNEESAMTDDYVNLAGVYINRLRKGMPLQADPTIKFALGDPSIKRILIKYLQVNSPYNTYLNKGLPPGPISMPSVKAIDAVLAYRGHKYLYFCAKADFSGYHVFAKTLQQHLQNASEYQKALDRNRIYK